MWTFGVGAEKGHFPSYVWRVKSINSVMEMEKLQLSLNSVLCLGTSPFPGHLLPNVWHLSAKLRKHCISLSYIHSEMLAGGFFCSHGRKGFCEAADSYKQPAFKCTLALKSFVVRTIF